MPETHNITIATRFEGPPGGGNGGYVGGILAEQVGGVAEVSLRAPVPIETPLHVVGQGGGTWALKHDGQVVAEGRPGQVDLTPPTPPALGQARAAGARVDFEHPFPGCFVCGPDRAEGDGLRILTGPLESGGAHATTWTPDASLAGEGGTVDPRFLWAALDCPGGIAAMATSNAPMVLGRMTTRIDGAVLPGDECIVIGWEAGHEGRKHFTGTALFDRGGAPIGCSSQIWIEVKPG